MARRRKKTTRRRSYRKKSRSRRAKAKPAGLAAGAAIGGAQGLFVPAAGASGSMFDAAKTLDMGTALARLPYVAKDPKVYTPLIAGAIASAAPRIPILGIVARPVDRGLKKLTRGKWGL